MARKKNDEEALKEQIRFTCVEFLASKGIGFTLDEVAKTLKISKKTIYKLFDSKNAIFISIIDEMRLSIRTRQQELFQSDLPLEEKLYKLLTIRVKYQETIGSADLNDFRTIAPEVYQYLLDAYSTGWNLVEQVLREGIESGKFRNVSIPLVIQFLQHGMQMLHQDRFLFDNSLSYEEAERQVIQIALCGIMTEPLTSVLLER